MSKGYLDFFQSQTVSVYLTRWNQKLSVYNSIRLLFPEQSTYPHSLITISYISIAQLHLISIYRKSEKKRIEHIYISSIRFVYSLQGWNVFTLLILAREKTLNDQKKLNQHLDISSEANAFNEEFKSFMIITSLERYNLYYKSIGFRRNSKFAERLAKRAAHMYLDLFDFFNIHEKQLNYY